MIVQKVIDLLLAEPTVNAIVGMRVYPRRLPDAPDYPALTVWKPAGTGSYTLNGDTGLEDARVQVDCYVDNGGAALIALKTAVRRFLSGFKGGGDSGLPCAIQTCMVINDFDLEQAATDRAGPKVLIRVLEFRIWNKEV